MLENEVIENLCADLQKNGWLIQSKALDRQKGYDICAAKDGKRLLVEAKGARGNPKNHSVVREVFDSCQIKDHLGKAIVKAFELKISNPTAVVAIAHPANEKIKKIVEPIGKQLLSTGLMFVFVRSDSSTEWLEGKLPN
ncbi:MAG: hypothetical protein AB7I27_18850 [Bacteriovoracaceae bacterium]